MIKSTFIIIIFVCAFATNLFGQNSRQITGVVRSPVGEALQNAVVILTGVDSVKVISYTNTDKNGQFSFPNNFADDQNLLIKVQLLGYKKEIHAIVNNQTYYPFTLTETPIILKDVVVVANFPKVKASGDTTSYLVSDFATKSDRTIGDVLNKIPGITVEDNGLIKFNGKTVKRLSHKVLATRRPRM